MISSYLFIFPLLCLLAAVVTLFLSWRWASVPAYAGLLLVYFLGWYLPVSELYYWGAAMAIVLGLNMMLPRDVVSSRMGLGYVITGGIAGMAVGWLISPWFYVLGVILGVFLGTLAFCFTPAGRHLGFPSRQYLQYLCAKGLPAAITLAIAAKALNSMFFELP